jgi:hypothetical protein
MPAVAQIRGLSLVLVGDFNPTIFHPRWFSSEGLLTDQEAKTATIHISHPDVTMFELSWMSLAVQRDRLDVTSLAEPYFERLVMLICKTFELLRHTPLRLLGINNQGHFRASTLDKWHALGDTLAPKEFWGEFFENPGMQSLEIRQVPRPDHRRGHLQVKVEPSIRVTPGVYIEVNDHFDVSGPDDIGASSVITNLQECWVASLEFAEHVFSKIAGEL